MAVTQLRRYQFETGTLRAWTEHWRDNVLPPRRQFGFEVLFAYADYTHEQFVWAVRFDGTAEGLERRDREYHDSPEWASLLAGKNVGLISATVSFIDEILAIQATARQ